MKNKKKRMIVYGIGILMMVVTLLIYPALPDQIPTNWGFDGHVSYDSKMTIWMITGLMIFMAVLFDCMPKIDPRRRNYEKFGDYYDGFCVVMQLFMMVMWGVIVIESLRPGTITVWKTVTVMLGILFMWIGNMLPKAKSNFYMGIKTPWSLSDDENWYRSNRLGGKTMFLAGVISLLSGLFLPEKPAFILFFTAVIAAAVIPCVMSYVWWRQKEGKQEEGTGR